MRTKKNHIRPKHHTTKYPYSLWLEKLCSLQKKDAKTSRKSRTVLVLDQGQDFSCLPRTMQETLWRWAKKEGLKLSAEVDGTSVYVYLV